MSDNILLTLSLLRLRVIPHSR
ncbi:hypothetical protein CBM2633_B80009 [Cupriavidus taiwanensis]|nr:hypothetical protein CBM2633_B80009 [Cupriavidus taiwanensis]